MSDRMKVVGVTIVLVCLWVTLKMALGLEQVAGLMETIFFILGIRWTAREIVSRWLSTREPY